MEPSQVYTQVELVTMSEEEIAVGSNIETVNVETQLFASVSASV
jgi:hypothetical protein